MDRGSWHCTGDRDQDHPQEKEMWNIKMALWGRPYKSLWKEEKLKAKEKRKDIPIWMQSSKELQGEIRKPSSASMQRNRGKQQNGKD